MSSSTITKNRHKWKSLSQQLAELMINSRQIAEDLRDKPQDEDGSLFNEQLYQSARWNHDPSYATFVSGLIGKTSTFNLLYQNAELVFQTVENYLELPYDEVKGGIKEVLMLIAYLAKELRHIFYPHFPKIFTLMVKMFDPQDAEFVASFFRTVVLLISSLAKQIINDLDNVLHLFIESLFIHEKDFTRRLGAQSLAYLLRKDGHNRTRAFHALINNCVSVFEAKKDEELSKLEEIKKEISENENEEASKKEKLIQEKTEETDKIIDGYFQRLVDSLTHVLFYTSFNLGTIYSFAEENIIKWCFDSKNLPTHPLINESFIKTNKKLSKHVNVGNQEKYLLLLSFNLPEIDHTLCLEVLSIWTNEKEGQFITDPVLALSILKQCFEDASKESVLHYLQALQQIEIPQEEYDTIALSVIDLIKNNIPITNLEECSQIAYASRHGVLQFFSEGTEYLNKLCEVSHWMRPPMNEVPEPLFKLLIDNLETKRTTVVPILEYIHNKEIYQKLQKLGQKSNTEMEIIYELMQYYESDKLSSEAPKLFKELGGHIMEEGALSIFSRLINVSKNQNAEWLKQEDPMFLQILNAIDYNISSQQMQKQASTILMSFLDTDKPLETLTDKELIIRCADLVFNSTHDLKSYREGEAAINRLTTDMMKCTKSIDFLLNNAFGFARQPYINFRSHASTLIAAIIKYNKEKFGPIVSNEIIQQFGICDSSLFAPCLIKATCEADYVDEKMVDLLYTYARQNDYTHALEPVDGEEGIDDTEEDQNEDEKPEKKENIAAKIVSQLITSLSAVRSSDSFAQKVDEATMLLLRSTKLDVRKAAFEVQFKYHVERNNKINEQIKRAIQQQLEAYVDPRSKIDSIMRLQTFVETLEFESEFVIQVAVALTIGCYFEYLTEKIRQKHQYHQLASSLLQSLSFLDPGHVEPVILATFPKDDKQETFRRAPLLIAPVLSRLTNQIYPYSTKIAEILTNSMRVCTNAQSKALKQCVKAITLFIETEIKMVPFFKDEDEMNAAVKELEEAKFAFVDNILKFFEETSKHSFEPLVRALTSCMEHFPALFAERVFLVQKIADHLPLSNLQCNSDLAMILAGIIQFIPSDSTEHIIEKSAIAINDEKLMNRPTFILGMLNLLSSMRDYHNTETFHELIINFLTISEEPQTIQIMTGITWTPEHFKELSRLIGRTLDPEFRAEFVPLICESLGEFAETFRTLNSDDITAKAVVYRDLDSVGEFSFVFSMQAFADMQINDFTLQNAAAGFLTKVIVNVPPLVTEFILPSIEFHLRKRHAKVPPAEIILLLTTITKQMPDLLPTMTRICELDCFRTLGTVDIDVRGEQLIQLGQKIEESDDWDSQEISKYLLPLLCQMAGSPHLADALAPVCRISTPESIEHLLHRLVSKVDRSTSILLLLDLCKAKAFTPDQVTNILLRVIEDKKSSNKTQLLLIQALLEINVSDRVIRRVMTLILHKALNKKQDVREVGQQAITSLTLKLPRNKYYDFFQAMRQELKEGYGIPLLYVSLNNFITNAPEVGAFDPFIKLLVECLLEDIFGRAAQQRVQMKDRVPEASKCHTFGTFQSLATKIVFDDSMKDIIEAFKAQFEALKTMDQARGAKRLIEDFSNGLTDNESIHVMSLVSTARDLLSYSKEDPVIRHRRFRKGEKEQKEIKFGRMLEDQYLFEKPVRDSEDVEKMTTQINLGKNFLISFFAMKMLSVFFDNDQIIPVDDDENNEEDQEKTEEEKELEKRSKEEVIKALDGLIVDIWNFTNNTTDRDALTLSLRILEHYARHEFFTTFNNKANEIFNFLAKELSQMADATNPLAKQVFSLVGTIFEKRTDIVIQSNFAEALVVFCMDKLDIHESCEDIYHVLTLLVQRAREKLEANAPQNQQIHMPSIIPAANSCYDLIIRSGSEMVRSSAADFAALVLTTYFKGKSQVIIEKLKFLLANLTTNRTASRRSILLFLKHFIEYSNEKQIEFAHDLIFIHLAAAIANETDDTTNNEIKELIIQLLSASPETNIIRDIDLMTKWANSGGKQTRTGILLLATTIPVMTFPGNTEDLINELQTLIKERIDSGNSKISLAAIQLHKAIISTYSEIPNVKLFSGDDLLNLISNKETCRVACELLNWYLTNYPDRFTPSHEQIIKLAEEMTRITFDWSGVIPESSQNLGYILLQFDDDTLVSFIPTLEHFGYLENNSENAILGFMRALVATIVRREPVQTDENEEGNIEVPSQYLRFVIKYINKQKSTKNKQLKTAAGKAIVAVQTAVREAFAAELVSIEEEESQRKKEKMEETAAEKLLDPETLRQRRKERRQQKKIEKRKKKYLEDDMFDGTLHPYGPDGKEVEHVDLPFIFHK